MPDLAPTASTPIHIRHTLFLGGESLCLICIGVLAVGARCVPGFGGHWIIWGVILTVAFLGMILQGRELMKGVSYAA